MEKYDSGNPDLGPDPQNVLRRNGTYDMNVTMMGTRQVTSFFYVVHTIFTLFPHFEPGFQDPKYDHDIEKI